MQTLSFRASSSLALFPHRTQEHHSEETREHSESTLDEVDEECDECGRLFCRRRQSSFLSEIRRLQSQVADKNLHFLIGDYEDNGNPLESFGSVLSQGPVKDGVDPDDERWNNVSLFLLLQSLLSVVRLRRGHARGDDGGLEENLEERRRLDPQCSKGDRPRESRFKGERG